MTEIPSILIDNIKKKNVILFLGSGFAYNAIHPKNIKPPLGSELANLISNKFLNGAFKDSSLTYITDLAISESDLFTVQSYIAELFEPFEPNENHLRYSTIPWKAIFTTNYDLILEKAYQKNKKRTIQELSKVYRNSPEHQIFKTPNSVPYYKLHGCISYINDNELPLILSTEQYITHIINRDRLFKKLEELGQDYQILFIGYSNQDHNIRAILKQLEVLKEARPRSFMVSPNFTGEEIRYWEGRKITPIPMGHEEFIKIIDEKITDTERKLMLYRTEEERKIYEKFQISPSELSLTDSLANFLDFDSEYVHSSIPTKTTTPNAFYKGFFYNWDPIIRNFDIERNIKDRILSDLILEDKYQDELRPFTFLIKGYGGSGKSVLLKRLAWEAAVEFDKLCLFIKPNTSLRIDPVIELYNYVKERIYIFIDNAIENESGIIELVKHCEKDNIPITIISTERINIWNQNLTLEKYVTDQYQLNYLQENEIEKLLDKLERHNSLGYLENKSIEERKNELADKSGRVLLVALYEATGGKPFEEIILDEFNSISNDDAKSLYITVSVFHRLGSEIRAGLISRVHNISFQEFKDKLYKPLEFIVFDEKNYLIGDYVYKTRHPFIAQMVFEMVLRTEQDRYDEYIRIISNLDIDYKSDWHAFLDITNSRKLIEIFNDPIKIRNIHDLAEEISPDEPKLLQQRAIFEMNSTSGSLFTAEKYLKKANEILTNDPIISHSLAEVSIKKAESSKNPTERKRNLENASSLLQAIIKKYKDQPHSYHSLLKISLIKFKDQIETSLDAGIENRIKEIEKVLNEVKQIFPDQEFILEMEAKFHEILDNTPKVIEVLKRAYEINKASPFISLRYSKVLEKEGNIDEAIKVLSDTLEVNPNERDVNYNYATLLCKRNPTDYTQILHYYRRSFTLGDTRYEAQFWYARALYLNKEFEKAKDFYVNLARARVGTVIKNDERGFVNSKSDLIKFSGTIIKQESSYAFIKRDSFGDDIFLHRSPNIKNWDTFKLGTNVTFYIAFNYKGPVAVDPKHK